MANALEFGSRTWRRYLERGYGVKVVPQEADQLDATSKRIEQTLGARDAQGEET